MKKNVQCVEKNEWQMRLRWVSGENSPQQVQYDGRTATSSVSTFSQSDMCSSNYHFALFKFIQIVYFLISFNLIGNIYTCHIKFKTNYVQVPPSKVRRLISDGMTLATSIQLCSQAFMLPPLTPTNMEGFFLQFIFIFYNTYIFYIL